MSSRRYVRGDTRFLTEPQAAHILHTSVSEVRRLIRVGELPAGQRYRHARLPREVVEALALRRWQRRRAKVADPYWITATAAAELLGVHRSRVRQLAEAGRIPFETAGSGDRLYRRDQLEVVANARLSRRLERG